MPDYLINAALRQSLRRGLSAFPRRPLEYPRERRAAVALPLVAVGHGADLPGFPRHAVWQMEAALLLTKRALHLRRHAGQWSFPGGRLDVGEDACTTALREMHEEVGIQAGADAVLGLLDDFITRSGFLMTPVVVWIGNGEGVWPNHDEVASVHRIPLAELQRPDAPILERIPESTGTVLKMPIGDNFIAAPTAAILYQFREVLLEGRHTRVAHFEQPAFAWS